LNLTRSFERMNHDQARRASEAGRGSGLGVAVGRLRELSTRASGALTRFRPTPASGPPAVRHEGLLPFGGWAFMAADVFEDDDKVIVRIEAPGMQREDFNVELHGDVVTVWGDKQFEREASLGRYSVLQCAYGSFRRDVALPVSVKADKTKASYRDGVLRIELPKSDAARARHIAVTTA
jgi:HSP20 family protein